jgi:hypothetical protein
LENLINSYIQASISFTDATNSYSHGIKKGVEIRLFISHNSFMQERKFELERRNLERVHIFKINRCFHEGKTTKLLYEPWKRVYCVKV